MQIFTPYITKQSGGLMAKKMQHIFRNHVSNLATNNHIWTLC
jgi:hypothetical protein